MKPFKARAMEEAEKYSQEKDGYFQYATKWSEVNHIFIDGAAFGFKLAVEYLRSEEAENKPRKAGTQFEFEKTWDNGDGWADWLLEKAGME